MDELKLNRHSTAARDIVKFLNNFICSPCLVLMVDGGAGLSRLQLILWSTTSLVHQPEESIASVDKAHS